MTEPKCLECKKDTLDKLIKSNELKKYMDKPLIVGLFAYAIFITVLTAIRNKVVFDDIKAFGVQIGVFFKTIFLNLKISITWVAEQWDRIPQPVVAVILHWLTIILLTVMAIGIIIYGIYWIYSKIAEPIKDSIDNTFLTVILGVLALIVFLGDLIKTLITLNLMWQYIIIIALFCLGRFMLERYQDSKRW